MAENNVVHGDDVFNYIANGFFLIVFSFFFILALLNALYSALKNRLLSIRSIIVTCLVTAIICVFKVIQLGFIIAQINVTNDGVLRGASAIAQLIRIYVIPLLTIYLAWYHVIELSYHSIHMREEEALITKEKTDIPTSRSILKGMAISISTVMTVIAVAGITLRILRELIRTASGLQAASDAFANFFTQMLFCNMVLVGIIGYVYLENARISADVISDPEYVKRCYLFVGYLILFEIYNLFTNVGPGSNVILSFYVVASLFIASAAAGNYLAKRPSGRRRAFVKQLMENFAPAAS
jgi:hypothetical protein